MKHAEIMTKFSFSTKPTMKALAAAVRTVYFIAMEREAIRLRCGIHDLLEEWYSTPEGDRSCCDHIPPDELARLLEGGR
jgi:hypothetical protein